MLLRIRYITTLLSLLLPNETVVLCRALFDERVERACAVAFQVDGHVGKAQFFQENRHFLTHFISQRSIQFIGSNLNAGEFAVNTKTELAKAEFAEKGFAAFDAGEKFGSDTGSIRDAGGKASRGGTVPCGKAGEARKFANFLFAKAGIEERRKNFVLRGSAMAGAKFMRIVGIDAVGDSGKTARASQGFEFVEKFVLAVVAAVGIVGHIKRIGKFAGRDAFVANARGYGERFGFAAVVGGKTRGKGGHGERAISERLMRGPGEIG